MIIINLVEIHNLCQMLLDVATNLDYYIIILMIELNKD